MVRPRKVSTRRESKYKARDFHSEGLVKVNINDTVMTAAKLMQQGGFDQLPVFDGDKVVGTVEARLIATHPLRKKDLNRFYNTNVGQIMKKPLPMVDEDEDISTVESLLRRSQAVLTTRRGKVIGIITWSNFLLIRSVYSRQDTSIEY